MDNARIGSLIYRLRKEKNLTQLQLAEKMNISDKTVSKWERGLGCPELSLLPELSAIFNVDLEKLLCGELEVNDILEGNMKKLRFYVCPSCGNIVTAMTDTGITCCGKKLKALLPEKAEDAELLELETVEDEYYISSAHPMTREHYISFLAVLTADGVLIKKLYPEWELQARVPRFAHGRVLWYCTKHGLLYRDI